VKGEEEAVRTSRQNTARTHDPSAPYLHLLPVVDLLVAHGNEVEGGGFRPTQGGWECTFRDPIDLDLVRRECELPDSISLSEQEISLFDRLSWSVIRGPRAEATRPRLGP